MCTRNINHFLRGIRRTDASDADAAATEPPWPPESFRSNLHVPDVGSFRETGSISRDIEETLNSPD